MKIASVIGAVFLFALGWFIWNHADSQEYTAIVISKTYTPQQVGMAYGKSSSMVVIQPSYSVLVRDEFGDISEQEVSPEEWADAEQGKAITLTRVVFH